jgi:hypothetical protein
MKSRKAANEALGLDAEEKSLVAEGLMSLSVKNKSDDFLALPAPQVKMEDIQAVIRAERDED